MSKSKFAVFAVIALAAGMASAQAREENCYRGARVNIVVDGVPRTGTEYLCDTEKRIVLDASPVAQYYPQQPVAPQPFYQVVPQPVYVMPQQVVVAPPPVYYQQPSQVYLGRNGVSVSVPGVYVNYGSYGYRHGYPYHYYHHGYRY